MARVGVVTQTMTDRPVGQLLRDWRVRRRLSQLELSLRVDVSTRHLSYIETGRSRPSPEMIGRLSEQLDLPLRERNAALLAGGYAPVHDERTLDHPDLARVADALRGVLDAHRPFPAVLLDRWWDIVDANDAVHVLTAGCDPKLLQPPVNALRLSLHPAGLARRMIDPGLWRAHLLEQLARRVESTADPRLAQLQQEILSWPGAEDFTAPPAHQVVVPLRLRHGDHVLSLFSLTSRVSTAADVTVDELTVETFHPADALTARVLTHGR